MKKNKELDWQLLFPSIIIIVLGLSVLASQSLSLFFNQLGFFCLGLIGFIFSSRFYYQNHVYLAKIYIYLSIILLILPYIFGAATRGAIRWIQVGFLTLQPSEIIKPFLIIILAVFLSQKARIPHWRNLISYFLIILIPVVLIFKQPDLGSTLVIGAIWLFMLLASSWPWYFPALVIALSLFTTPIILKLMLPYQLQRLTTFINPYADPKASGYHLIQSIIAVGSGGLAGKGFGHGLQSQLQFLPESHTDFIFASLAEEMGFIGSFILLLAYFFFLKRLLTIAKECATEFAYLIVMGVFSMISFQVILNIGMNLGLLPITGITLPLVSSGGSSIIATMISLGIIVNISGYGVSKRPLEIK